MYLVYVQPCLRRWQPRRQPEEPVLQLATEVAEVAALRWQSVAVPWLPFYPFWHPPRLPFQRFG